MAHHDYSTPGAGGEKLELVVRPGNRYGDATEGDLVTIDARDYRGASIKGCLMTGAEALKLRDEELKKAREEAEKATGSRPKTVAMVESALAALTARARLDRAQREQASPLG